MKKYFIIGALVVFASAVIYVTAAVTVNAPSNLVASSSSTTQINLVWQDNSTNELGFKVERSSDGVAYTQIAQIGANVTSFTSTGLTPSTTYYYRVRAFAQQGRKVIHSTYSNVAAATTDSVVLLPAAPSNLATTLVYPTATSTVPVVSVTWQDNADNEATYHVERSTNGASFVQRNILSANANEYTDSSVSSGNVYTYRVRACNAGGCSAYSNEASATLP